MTFGQQTLVWHATFVWHNKKFLKKKTVQISGQHTINIPTSLSFVYFVKWNAQAHLIRG